jgi:hypothetical protein
MRSRTILYTDDPFAPERLPMALLAVDDDGDVYVEPIPVLADLSWRARWLIDHGLRLICDEARADCLPEGCGPHVSLSDWHPLLKSLSPPEYDALCRIMARPEQRAKVQAAIDRANRETMETLRYRLIHERGAVLGGWAR